MQIRLSLFKTLDERLGDGMQQMLGSIRNPSKTVPQSMSVPLYRSIPLNSGCAPCRRPAEKCASPQSSGPPRVFAAWMLSMHPRFERNLLQIIVVLFNYVNYGRSLAWL